MSGWVSIPKSALASTTPEEAFAVLDIYRRADALGWAPLRLTERSCCRSWRMGNSRFWSLLATLEGLGLIAVVKGGRRVQTVVTVFDPKARHKDKRSGLQNVAGSSSDISESAVPIAAPIAETSVKKKEKNQYSLGVLQVWNHWRTWHPRAKERPPVGHASLIRGRLAEASVAELQLVATWVHEAPGASFYRDKKKTGCGTIYKANKWADRLEEAQEWQQPTPKSKEPRWATQEEMDERRRRAQRW